MSSSTSARYNMFVALRFTSTGARNEMGKAGRSFDQLSLRIRRAGRAISYGAYEVTGALARIGAAATAFALITGKSFVDFQKQMSSLRSVLGSEAGGTYDLLNQRAKELMVTTRYTGAEIASGMEQMIRQGVDGMDTFNGIAGVLSAAAAENMGLADAAQVVATTLRTFNLEATQATAVANSMAATSMASGTNMQFLASSIRYGAGQASLMGISLRDMNVAFGLMANLGMKGTMAGTSFNQMLVSLQREAPKTKKILDQLGVDPKDEKGQFVGLFGENGLLVQLQEGLSKFSPMDQGKMLSEAFNIRGARAVQRLLAAIAQPEMYERLVRTVDKANEGIGAAQRMANIKLWNISGQFKLLRDAITGVTNEFWDRMTPRLTMGLAKIVGSVQQVGTALVYMGTEYPSDELIDSFHRTGDSHKEVARGIMDGVDRIRDNINRLRRIFVRTFGSFAKNLRNNISQLMVVGSQLSALGPAALSAMMAVRLLSGSVRMLWGMASVAFSPLGFVIAGLAVSLRVFSKEGETAFETMINAARTLGNILETVVIKPLRIMREYIGDLGTVAALFGGASVAWAGGAVAKGAMMSKLFGAGAGGIGGLVSSLVGGAGVPVYVTNIAALGLATGATSRTGDVVKGGLITKYASKAGIKKLGAGILAKAGASGLLTGIGLALLAAAPVAAIGGMRHFDNKRANEHANRLARIHAQRVGYDLNDPHTLKIINDAVLYSKDALDTKYGIKGGDDVLSRSDLLERYIRKSIDDVKHQETRPGIDTNIPLWTKGGSQFPGYIHAALTGQGDKFTTAMTHNEQLYHSAFMRKTDVFGKGQQRFGIESVITSMMAADPAFREYNTKLFRERKGFELGFNTVEGQLMPFVNRPPMIQELTELAGLAGPSHQYGMLLDDPENLTARDLRNLLPDIINEFGVEVGKLLDISTDKVADRITDYISKVDFYERLHGMLSSIFKIDGKKVTDTLDTGDKKNKRGEGSVKSLARPHFRYRTGN